MSLQSQVSETSYHKEMVHNFQRTARGRRFEAEMAAYREMLLDGDTRAMAALNESNAALVAMRDTERRRDVGVDAVHVDAVMTNMSVRFQNDAFIGDRLMPVVTVDKQSNVYFIYDERAQLNFPDDLLSGRGQANEVWQDLPTGQYRTQDRGLERYVDMNLIANADLPLNPLMNATMLINEGIAFNRERRLSGVLTNAANYGANTVAIGAGQEWNSATGGNPIKLIQKAVDDVFSGPNSTRLMGFCSINVFRTLSRHPAIRDLFKYNRDGFATAGQLAAYFGLDELLVGRARYDSTPQGASATVGRLWPDAFGVVRVATSPSTDCYHFGTTFRWGAIETKQIFKQEAGKSGGYICKVTLSEDHRIVAPRAGYLITNCFNPALGG